MTEYYVYILLDHNNHLYTGITNNLISRINKHNTGRGAKVTRKSTTWKYYKIYGSFTKASALRFEWFSKHEKINNKWKRIRSGLEYKIKIINNLLYQDEWSYIIDFVII